MSAFQTVTRTCAPDATVPKSLVCSGATSPANSGTRVSVSGPRFSQGRCRVSSGRSGEEGDVTVTDELLRSRWSKCAGPPSRWTVA